MTTTNQYLEDNQFSITENATEIKKELARYWDLAAVSEVDLDTLEQKIKELDVLVDYIDSTIEALIPMTSDIDAMYKITIPGEPISDSDRIRNAYVTKMQDRITNDLKRYRKFHADVTRLVESLFKRVNKANKQ
jgi:hypothetical protein